MPHPIWPLFDLRLRTDAPGGGRLELRLPTEDDLVELIGVAKAGIHAPEEMPFAVAWTDLRSPAFERSAFQFHIGARASWRADSWVLPLGVWHDGRGVGMQDISASSFATLRTVVTGSWLGSPFQGRGIGKAMRQAVLALAFDHLGAEVAESGALTDNPASVRVSQALGYEPNGVNRIAPRGIAREHQRFRLTVDGWRSRPRPTVEVEGLEACRELFGVAPG